MLCLILHRESDQHLQRKDHSPLAHLWFLFITFMWLCSYCLVACITQEVTIIPQSFPQTIFKLTTPFGSISYIVFSWHVVKCQDIYNHMPLYTRSWRTYYYYRKWQLLRSIFDVINYSTLPDMALLFNARMLITCNTMKVTSIHKLLYHSCPLSILFLTKIRWAIDIIYLVWKINR